MHYGSLERKIGGGQDSTVWQRKGNVVKFYRRLKAPRVYTYHRLQSAVAHLIQKRLDNTLVLPKDIHWGNHRVEQISLDVLRLPENAIYDTFDEVVGEPPERSLRRCPERFPYESVSVVELVPGHRLVHGSCDDIGIILDTLTGYLESFGLPIGNNKFDPVNIKAGFQNGQLSLVVTDVLTSVERFLDEAEGGKCELFIDSAQE